MKIALFLIIFFGFATSVPMHKALTLSSSTLQTHHSGIKRGNADYDHDQGPDRKKFRVKSVTQNLRFPIANQSVYAAVEAAILIKKDKPCCYLEELPDAQKITDFLKLNFSSKTDSLMVPVHISSVPNASIQNMNFSKGFSALIKDNLCIHHPWFPNYLPYAWLLFMSEELPLIMRINSSETLYNIPTQITLWPLKSINQSYPFQELLNAKYEDFIERESQDLLSEAMDIEEQI